MWVYSIGLITNLKKNDPEISHFSDSKTNDESPVGIGCIVMENLNFVRSQSTEQVFILYIPSQILKYHTLLK